MKALIDGYSESLNCTWCENEREGVMISFDGGFLNKAPLCFKCLQQAVRVRNKQESQHGGNGAPIVAAQNEH